MMFTKTSICCHWSWVPFGINTSHKTYLNSYWFCRQSSTRSTLSLLRVRCTLSTSSSSYSRYSGCTLFLILSLTTLISKPSGIFSTHCFPNLICWFRSWYSRLTTPTHQNKTDSFHSLSNWWTTLFNMMLKYNRSARRLSTCLLRKWNRQCRRTRLNRKRRTR